MTAIRLRLRADLRQRWRAWLGLALLIMLFFGPALSAYTGARRTQSAYPRFLERQRAWDILLLDASIFASVLWKPDYEALEALPYLDTSARVVFGDYLGLTLIGDPSGHYGRTLNKAKVVEGRLPDPAAPNEVAIPSNMDVDLTDPVLSANRRALASAPIGTEVTLKAPDGSDDVVKVVGRIVSPFDLPPNEFPANGMPSSAMVKRLQDRAAEAKKLGREPPSGLFLVDAIALRFDQRADISRFDRDLQALTKGKAVNPARQAVNARAILYSARLQSLALALVAGVAGLTAVLLLVQTLVRQTALDSSEHPTLNALGMSNAQLVVLSLIRVAGISFVGATLAALAAWLSSGAYPFGVFRLVEPQPGLHADVLTMVLLPLAIVGLSLVATALPAWRAVKVASDKALTRPSFVAGVLARTRLPAQVVAGVRLALERGRGRTAVPVRSTMTIVTLGVAAMVVALTLSSSITTLLDTPAYYGRTWDKVVNYGTDDEGESPAINDDTLRDLTAQTEIEAIAVIDTGAPTRVNGRRVGSLMMLNVKGSLYPPVMEGRAPEAPDEILLGSKTLRALKKKVDLANPDTVSVSLEGIDGSLDGLKIVGRAAVPPISDFSRFGEGLVMRADAALAQLVGDNDVPPPTDALVKFAPGVDQNAVIARLAERHKGLQIGDDFARRPSDVVDFGRVQGTPLILAAVLALIGAASLTHALVTVIRRRRRDLAILKTLGFVRGQVRGAVAWQSSAITLIALALGLPLGLIVGRTLWNFIAGTLGVVPAPQVPMTALAVMVPASILLANLIAALPARAAARTQPALVLRSE